MYKTVRKGDASLQYTILPQTDVPSFVVQTESPKTVPVTKYSIVVVMLIIITSFSTAALINQTYFANTILALPKKIIQTSIANTHINVNSTNTTKDKYKDTKDQTAKPTVKLIVETLNGKDDELAKFTTPTISEESEGIKVTDVATEPSSTLRSILRIPITMPRRVSSSTDPPTALKTGSPSAVPYSSTVQPKKSKIPKITLKLRRNETIPEMYMKSVIASNEKGNITTSVLAHGLSLEGLIFKTPDRTIRPWSEPVHNRIRLEVIISLRTILVLLGLIAIITLWILIYVQRKMMKRQKQNAEESEGDKLEGDNSLSTPLKTEIDETE